MSPQEDLDHDLRAASGVFLAVLIGCILWTAATAILMACGLI
jgi:hypothetical protein